MATPVQERAPLSAPRPAPAAGWPWAGRTAVLVPAIVAAGLVFTQITGRSLGFDEGATVSIASSHGATLWAGIAHDGGNMSGYYLLLHVLIGLFGDGLLVLRIVSALAVVATVALVALIGRRLFDPLVAFVAGVLAAVSVPLVYWGQTARGYAPMVALVCAGTLAFIALVDGREDERPARGPWIGYVVAMTLAMYCSFVAVLVVPAQLLVLARRRRAWRPVGGALAAVALCCAPLLVLAVRRGSGQLFWVTPPNRMVDTQVLQSVTSAGLSPVFHPTGTTYVLMWATVAAVVGLVVDLAGRRRSAPDAWGRSLVLGWCVLPAGMTFLYSLVSQPIFVPRNVLMSTPAIALALALPLRDRGWARAGAAAALVAVLALRVLQLSPSYGVSPEPWATVTRTVLARAQPGDCATFYPEDARMAFAYYVDRAAAGHRAPRSVLPVIPWGVVRPFVERYVTPSPSQLARRTAGCRRMWMISSHEGQPNGPLRSRIHRARWFGLDAELERRFGVAPMRRYGYASIIHVQLLPGPRGSVSGAGRRPASPTAAGSTRRTSAGSTPQTGRR